MGSASITSNDEAIVIKNSDLIYEPPCKTRQWLIKRGKGHLLDFKDDELRILRECFD